MNRDLIKQKIDCLMEMVEIFIEDSEHSKAMTALAEIRNLQDQLIEENERVAHEVLGW